MSRIIQEAEVERKVEETKSFQRPSFVDNLSSVDNPAMSFLLALLIGGFAFGLTYLIGSSTLNSHQPFSDSPKQWFEGGLLAQTTVNEWKVASHRDKLATAAVYAKVHIRYTSPASYETILREAAEKLVDCMDNEAKSSDKNRSVAALADYCLFKVSF